MIAIVYELITSEKSIPLSSLPVMRVLAETKCWKIFLPVALHDF